MADTSETDDRYYYESQPIFNIGGEHSTVNIFLNSGRHAEVAVAPSPTPVPTPTSVPNVQIPTPSLNEYDSNGPNIAAVPRSFYQSPRNEQVSDSQDTVSTHRPRAPLQNLLNSTLHSLPVEFLSPEVRGTIEEMLNNHGQSTTNTVGAGAAPNRPVNRPPATERHENRQPAHQQESPETERNISVSFVVQPSTRQSNLSSLIQNLLGQTPTNRGLHLEQLNEHTEIEVVSAQDEEPDRCAVCHDPILEGQIVRRVRRCNHRFHTHCLDRWLEANHTCPLCMQTIVPSADTMNEEAAGEAADADDHDEEREPLIDPSDRELTDDTDQESHGPESTADTSSDSSARQRNPPPTLPITVRSIRRVYNMNTGETTTEHIATPQDQAEIAPDGSTDHILEATLAEFVFDDDEGVFQV